MGEAISVEDQAGQDDGQAFERATPLQPVPSRSVEEQLEALADLMESGEGVDLEEVYPIVRRGAKTLRQLIHGHYVGHIGECGVLTDRGCTCGLHEILNGAAR